MSEIKINSELEGENNEKINLSKEIFITQKKNWEDVKHLISKNIKEIFFIILNLFVNNQFSGYDLFVCVYTKKIHPI